MREFFAERALVTCEAWSGCCAKAQRPHDVQACTDLITLEPLQPPAFDAQAAAECLSGLSAAHTTCPPSEEPEACEHAVRGSAAFGESCRYDFDCALVAGELVRCSLETGTCQKRVPVIDGRPCDYEAATEWSNCSVEVDPGFYCDHDTDTCRPNTAIGAPCAIEAECGLEGHCAGVCEARTPVGGDCSASQCVQEAYCDASNVCAPDKAVGDACSTNSECPASVCDSETGVCDSVLPAACVD